VGVVFLEDAELYGNVSLGSFLFQLDLLLDSILLSLSSDWPTSYTFPVYKDQQLNGVILQFSLVSNPYPLFLPFQA
jgi:hypothetical protein